MQVLSSFSSHGSIGICSLFVLSSQFVGIHDDNLMDNRSLSLMLSPVLFRCPEQDLLVAAKLTTKESKVVETLLDELAVFM